MEESYSKYAKDISRELSLDLVRRSSAGAYAYIILGLGVALTAFRSQDNVFLIKTLGWVATIGAVARVVLAKWILKTKPELGTESYGAHKLLIFLNANLWGAILFFINYSNSQQSFTFFLSISTMCAIMLGGVSSLSPSPLLQIYFFATNTFIPVIGLTLRAYQTQGLADNYIYPMVLPAVFVYCFVQGRQFRSHLVKRYEYEFMIRDEKNHLQSVIDSVPGFIIYLDKNLVVSSISQGLEKRFDNVVGVGQSMDTDKYEFTQMVRRFSISGLKNAAHEVCVSTKVGKEWFLISFSKIDKTDEIIIVGTSIDELRKARDQMQDQTNKAMGASKLAALGELAAGAGHEINNPVAIVHGYMTEMKIALLKDTSPLKEKFLDKVEKSMKSLMRIKKIVSGMRLLSRDATHDPLAPTSFKSVLEDTLSLCQERFVQHGIDFKVAQSPDVELNCRATQVSQVLLNVLNNAYDAIEKNTSKTIDVRFEQADGKFKVIIADNGPGVATENLDRIYDPFFTTKDPGKGTGLGLAISKRIMAEHEGSIYYNYKNGAEFTLEFPLLKAVSSPSKAS